MKRIVIYYSYGGNTEEIARRVSEKLNCDILKLEPKISFTTDYDNLVSQWQNNSTTKGVSIKDINIDLKEYDEIILGTPVWWYTISPVITEFIRNYDLTGKVVYPFATNAGWLGRTFKDIKRILSKSKVMYEQNIEFAPYSSNLVTKDEEIDAWIEKIKGENND